LRGLCATAAFKGLGQQSGELFQGLGEATLAPCLHGLRYITDCAY
jgi:hypothetical protein